MLARISVIKTVLYWFIFIALMIVGWELSNYLVYDLLDIQGWLAIMLMIISLLSIFAILHFLLSLFLGGFIGILWGLIDMLISDLGEKKKWGEVFWFSLLYIIVYIGLNIPIRHLFGSQSLVVFIMPIAYFLIVTYYILKAKNRLKDLKISIPSFLLASILGIVFIPFLISLNPVLLASILGIVFVPFLTRLNPVNSKVLYSASFDGHADSVKRLIDAGVDVNAKDDDGFTALHNASTRKHVNIVKILIDAGADANAKDKYGITALHFQDCTDIAKLLIDAGADVNAKDDDGFTALHNASLHGRADIVKLLIDAGADIDAADNDGKTALYFASEEGHADIVKLLIDAGADIDAKDDKGRTVLHIASKEGHADIVTLLKQVGAKK